MFPLSDKCRWTGDGFVACCVEQEPEVYLWGLVKKRNRQDQLQVSNRTSEGNVSASCHVLATVSRLGSSLPKSREPKEGRVSSNVPQ